jgi:hypothetical protein
MRRLQVHAEHLAGAGFGPPVPKPHDHHRALSQLSSLGFAGRARVNGGILAVRIERQGETVYALDVQRGGFSGDDQLDFVVGGTRFGGGTGSNGYATPYFDRVSGQSRLRMMDFSVLGIAGGSEQTFTKEELFSRLWDRIVEQLERF